MARCTAKYHRKPPPALPAGTKPRAVPISRTLCDFPFSIHSANRKKLLPTPSAINEVASSDVPETAFAWLYKRHANVFALFDAANPITTLRRSVLNAQRLLGKSVCPMITGQTSKSRTLLPRCFPRIAATAESDTSRPEPRRAEQSLQGVEPKAP